MTTDKNTNKYLFIDANLPIESYSILKQVDELSRMIKKQFFAISAPMLLKEDYEDTCAGFLILSPGRKIIAVKMKDKTDKEFDEYLLDIRADIATLAHKYEFTKIIGRERIWKDLIVENIDSCDKDLKHCYETELKLSGEEKRKADIIISLLIGSINDAKKIGNEVPSDLLDRVKRKILIFDTDQTRFIYGDWDKTKSIVRIQGLSGTGKTELLLHKLKDLYVKETDAKIAFTCFNRVLADSLKKRIPQFFNFSKVDRQIEWNSKLWCFNAWGRSSDINSGALRYICNYYGIVFQGYGIEPNFNNACLLALHNIKAFDGIKDKGHAFTYFFIDESQDFSDGFVQLIDYVTEKRVYMAGDTFQTIFDHDLNKEDKSKTITPDHVLNRCYRTAPLTFMFAQALGMGLFEKQKLSWMPDGSWSDCGYIVDGKTDSTITLTREPLRRFDDEIDDSDNFTVIESDAILNDILSILYDLKTQYESIEPNDVAIIFLDDAQYIYNYSVMLKDLIYHRLNWKSNLAYESKENSDDSVFITNRNNVKGLEFPFVICVSSRIIKDVHYRNSLYTMLTRSFLKSFLILGKNGNGYALEIRQGAEQIKSEGKMTLQLPSEEDLKKMDEIAANWKVTKKILSLRERIEKLLKDNNKSPDSFNRVYEFVRHNPEITDEQIKIAISIL